MSKVKTILIEKEQSNWLEKKSINLSKYVRNKINEDMKEEKENERK